ncbi:hypothetical protein [Hymenobacter rigui]|uniref:hypothetical protein n=1 Tax=Hymenobacter rigui TaxID=334424 RepID=UPI0014777E49|nr:hypothetical protein [Hymenobacter rigui]
MKSLLFLALSAVLLSSCARDQEFSSPAVVPPAGKEYVELPADNAEPLPVADKV